LRVRGDFHGTSYYGPHLFAATTVTPPEADIRQRIARTNYETVTRLGVETLEAVFRDILRDRDETHARLLGGEAE
jgi:hypothetical protein